MKKLLLTFLSLFAAIDCNSMELEPIRYNFEIYLEPTPAYIVEDVACCCFVREKRIKTSVNVLKIVIPDKWNGLDEFQMSQFCERIEKYYPKNYPYNEFRLIQMFAVLPPSFKVHGETNEDFEIQSSALDKLSKENENINKLYIYLFQGGICYIIENNLKTRTLRFFSKEIGEKIQEMQNVVALQRFIKDSKNTLFELTGDVEDPYESRI